MINYKENINITTFNNKIDIFINKCFSEMEKQNIKISISLNNFVKYTDNSNVNGFFGLNNSTNNEFSFCVGKNINQWFPIFIHEYCHFKQWKESKNLWNQGELSCGIIFEWLENNNAIIDSNIYLHIKNIQDLESDCEKRTLSIIKKYFTNIIDPKLYGKKSNAYVLFYNIVRDYHKWYEIGKEPYNDEEILDIIPSKIISSPYKYPSKNLENLYLYKYGV